ASPSGRFQAISPGRFATPRHDSRPHRVMAGHSPARPFLPAQYGARFGIYRGVEFVGGSAHSLQDNLCGIAGKRGLMASPNEVTWRDSGADLLCWSAVTALQPLYALLVAPSFLFLATLGVMLFRPPDLSFYSIDRFVFALL